MSWLAFRLVAVETSTPTETSTATPFSNNIPDDSDICEAIKYPNFNQPNSVNNTLRGIATFSIGTTQNDEFWGSHSGNIFNAASGDDNLYGGDSNDILNGNSGNDFIKGGSGNDILLGERNNDIALGELGNDLIWGGKGSDSLNG